MVLTVDIAPARRGQPAPYGSFGYPIAPGEKVFRGSLLAVNASGQAQRIQTAGSLAFIGLSSRFYDNTGNAAAGPAIETLKGCYALTVAGATVANINQSVYASDDGTCGLANAQTGVYARGGSDTGTGTAGAITATAGAKAGVYLGTILGGATTFSFVDPNGDALANGTLGSAYAGGGLGFTVSNAGTSFIAGDTFTVTVTESTGAMLIGSLAGIESGQTYVKLLGG